MPVACFHFSLSGWSVSCGCPGPVSPLGIVCGKRINLLLWIHSLRTKKGHMKTWCGDYHTPPRYSGLWAPCHDRFGLSLCFIWEDQWVSASHPPPSLSTHLSPWPCFYPNSGHTEDSTEHSWSVVWMRQVALSILYPPGLGQTPPDPDPIFSTYLPIDFWHLSVLKWFFIFHIL